jgi:hypothetical protein
MLYKKKIWEKPRRDQPRRYKRRKKRAQHKRTEPISRRGQQDRERGLTERSVGGPQQHVSPCVLPIAQQTSKFFLFFLFLNKIKYRKKIYIYKSCCLVLLGWCQDKSNRLGFQRKNNMKSTQKYICIKYYIDF